MKCLDCDGTGITGDNGPGIKGNKEVVPCDCEAGDFWRMHSPILDFMIRCSNAGICPDCGENEHKGECVRKRNTISIENMLRRKVKSQRGFKCDICGDTMDISKQALEQPNEMGLMACVDCVEWACETTGMKKNETQADFQLKLEQDLM